MKKHTTYYRPTSKDVSRITRNNHTFKISGDKIFATLQGEGLLESDGGTAGCPAVFLRLHWCNLHCGHPIGWKCDTGYTWDTSRKEYWQEPEDWTIEKTKKAIEDAWKIKFGDTNSNKRRVVITGGEPLIQQDLIVELVTKMPEWMVEIETNGTIEPKDGLERCQLNCSPKLSNSGNKKSIRLKPRVLRVVNDWPVSWFKFVVNERKDLDEIEKLVTDCQLNPKKILIMPEGLTKEVVDEHQKIVENMVLAKGWRIIMRNQLLWFGPKRRT